VPKKALLGDLAIRLSKNSAIIILIVLKKNFCYFRSKEQESGNAVRLTVDLLKELND
jgi:hypothetical protein